MMLTWLMNKLRPAPTELSGYEYVYVEEDGTARELHAAERAWLETRFEGGDGARPYIKLRYGSRTPVVRSRKGYLKRSSLPRRLSVKPAPENDPFPPATLAQAREQLVREGHTIVDHPDGSFTSTLTREQAIAAREHGRDGGELFKP